MSDAKIELELGQIRFSAEGNQDWISKQLDKILSKAEELISIAPTTVPQPDSQKEQHQSKKKTPANIGTLPAFLKEKNATQPQVKKFLATAVWLRESKSKNQIKTSDVTKALRDANQKRLGNAADCLNRNVSKGYCEKNGKEFFVTDEGRASL